MKLGIVYPLPPEPLDLDRTLFVDAGAIRVGIEYRDIDSASLRDAYAGDPRLAASLEQIIGNKAVSDRGISLHVCGADDGHEYLRFDCFDGDPHYHYNHRVAQGATAVNHWIPFDRAACGDMLDWAFARIRSHLPEMLSQARGEHLVPALDAATIDAALVEITRLAKPGAVR